jgi:hypothetical protein
MAEQRSGLPVGAKLKEVATRDIVYRDCTLLHADAVGLAFEVQRTRSDDGGNVELVTSQMLIPWFNIKHVVLMEQELG